MLDAFAIVKAKKLSWRIRKPFTNANEHWWPIRKAQDHEKELVLGDYHLFLLSRVDSSIQLFQESVCLKVIFYFQGLWSSLHPRLVSLTINDCINVADECVCAVTQLLPALYEFNLQVCFAIFYNGPFPASFYLFKHQYSIFYKNMKNDQFSRRHWDLNSQPLGMSLLT